jgi:hypothetical protein
MTDKQKDTNMLDPKLKEQYDIFEDENYLKSESAIVPIFTNIGYDYLDCGQGYYTDTTDIIAYVDGKFYKVTIDAEITSAKQDCGDRLYWVDDIKSVTYIEIPKPEPKSEELFTFYIKEYQVKNAINVLKNAGITYLLSKTDD